jgi:hypothetical protein
MALASESARAGSISNATVLRLVADSLGIFDDIPDTQTFWAGVRDSARGQEH